MKVTFEFTEEIWSKGPFTIEIPDNKLSEYAPNMTLEETKDCEREINDYIFSNYSIQDLIKMGARWDGITELTITEINKQ